MILLFIMVNNFIFFYFLIGGFNLILFKNFCFIKECFN